MSHVREDRTFENMGLAIDMQEIFERVSIRAHGSFLPHGAVDDVKTTRDIIRVAEVLEGPARLVEPQRSPPSERLRRSRFWRSAVRDLGVASMPASRVAQRDGPGRSKRLSAGPSWSQLGGEYDPRCDSCLLAFARAKGIF